MPIDMTALKDILYSAVLSDLLDEFGHRDQAMRPFVRPLDENFAVVVGKYRLDRGKKDGGNAGGLFTLVLEKTDKGWKIIIDHTT